MNKKPFDVPILFLIFNRLDVSEKVFNEIKKISPKKLFVVADGPRKDNLTDKFKCQQTRDLIKRVDWDCEVKTLFREQNLGCRMSLKSGITWFFEHVEEGIILEDDTVPEQSFFLYCQEMLERYRYDERIGLISGNNYYSGKKRNDYSYYFSLYAHIWGWATWRRVWKKYDNVMNTWPEIRDNNWLHDVFRHEGVENFFTDIFEKVYRGEVNAWSYQLQLVDFTNNYLVIHPNKNLVANIGFGEDSTHTKGTPKSEYLHTKPIEFPLLHPPYVIRDSLADDYYHRNILPQKLTTMQLLKIYSPVGLWLYVLWPIAGHIKRSLLSVLRK